MRLGITSKGDWKDTEKWLRSASKKTPKRTLNAIGAEGVSSLRSMTPVRTGQTASGWNYKVVADEVYWYNSAHADRSVNVAVLLDKGHGTGTGGYVPPRPYIRQAMRPILDKAGDRIVKEMVN